MEVQQKLMRHADIRTAMNQYRNAHAEPEGGEQQGGRDRLRPEVGVRGMEPKSRNGRRRRPGKLIWVGIGLALA